MPLPKVDHCWALTAQWKAAAADDEAIDEGEVDDEDVDEDVLKRDLMIDKLIGDVSFGEEVLKGGEIDDVPISDATIFHRRENLRERIGRNESCLMTTSLGRR